MAIAAEESARDFYDTLSQRFPKQETLFEQLSNDEKGHAKRYKQLLTGEEVYSTEEERMLADYNIQALENSGVVGSLRSKVSPRCRGSDGEGHLAFISLNVDGSRKKDREEIYKIIRVEHSHLSKVQSLAV